MGRPCGKDHSLNIVRQPVGNGHFSLQLPGTKFNLNEFRSGFFPRVSQQFAKTLIFLFHVSPKQRTQLRYTELLSYTTVR
jgi:hypothetical protein